MPIADIRGLLALIGVFYSVDQTKMCDVPVERTLGDEDACQRT